MDLFFITWILNFIYIALVLIYSELEIFTSSLFKTKTNLNKRKEKSVFFWKIV